MLKQTRRHVNNVVLFYQAKRYQVTVWAEPTNPPTYQLLDDGFKDAERRDVSVSYLI